MNLKQIRFPRLEYYLDRGIIIFGSLYFLGHLIIFLIK
jgi:hypothetical protein